MRFAKLAVYIFSVSCRPGWLVRNNSIYRVSQKAQQSWSFGTSTGCFDLFIYIINEGKPLYNLQWPSITHLVLSTIYQNELFTASLLMSTICSCWDINESEEYTRKIVIAIWNISWWKNKIQYMNLPLKYWNKWPPGFPFCTLMVLIDRNVLFL